MRERIGHPMQIRAFSAPDKSGNPAHGFSVRRSAFGVQRSAFSVKFREHFRFQIPKIKVINQLDSGFAFSVILRARLSDGFDDQLSEREAER
jgi:hypothetical protein